MKVFISHSHSQIDEPLVRTVTKALQNAGLEVWDDRIEIFPGDNWAEKVAQALRESEAMVVLLTPNALDSQWVDHDIGYALGEYRFRNRLVTVLAGPPEKLPEEKIPWILRRLKIIKLGENGKEDHIKQIAQALLETA
ncbi:MAG: toll/interleukin-1 receptor domain-containing protein [bacterium]